MRAEYANPFITAAITTFQKELKVKLNRNSINVKEAPVPSKQVSIIIGVTGMVKGQVVYSMDDNVAFAVAPTRGISFMRARQFARFVSAGSVDCVSSK